MSLHTLNTEEILSFKQKNTYRHQLNKKLHGVMESTDYDLIFFFFLLSELNLIHLKKFKHRVY